MKNKQLKILKDNVWVEIDLLENNPIRYNKVINKISDFESRSLSHTNTFSIELTYNNRQAFGINVFNVQEMSLNLNIKYVAKYFINNTLSQKGFVVINNMDGDILNLNLIDEPLDLFDKWGDISFKDFLQSSVLQYPSDYQSSIDELRNYTLSKTALVPFTNEVGSRGYHLGLFPNNLNTIGNDFQLDSDGLRLDNQFNPYQSRPIFNAKAFLDLITETYGYTPIYNETVNWEEFESTYIISPNANSGEEGGSAFNQEQRSFSRKTNFHFSSYNNVTELFTVQVGFTFQSSVGISPNSLTNFPPNPPGVDVQGNNWFSENRIYSPNISGGNSGLIRFLGECNSTIIPHVPQAFVVYKDTSVTNGYVIESALINSNSSTFNLIDFTIDKSQFDSPSSADAGELIGVYVNNTVSNTVAQNLVNMYAVEQFLTEGEVSFDKNKQFLPTNVDLTYAAPKENLKDLLKGLLQWRSVLIDVKESTKEVMFFSYEFYKNQKRDGNYYNWSEYFLKFSEPKYNTNYGNKYAKKNRISLKSPYSTNYYDEEILSQGDLSRLKDFSKNEVSLYKDIETVFAIGNSVTPYYEYQSKGLGLVKHDGTIGDLTQSRADGSMGLTISNLPAIKNTVNYETSKSNKNWYELIGNSIKVEAEFLLPINVFKNIDLTYPVYINDLNGFYIIEEVEEYSDEETPVNVKLIKLPDVESSSDNGTESIDYSAIVIEPNPVIFDLYWKISANFTFNNWTGTSATLEMIKTDENGVPLGSGNISEIIPQSNIDNNNFI